MLKKILKIIGLFVVIFILVAIIVIYYWRDIYYQPSETEVFCYFLGIPILLTSFVCLIWVIKNLFKSKQNQTKPETENKIANDNEIESAPKPSPEQKSGQIDLKIYNPLLTCSLGDNHEILPNLIKGKAAEFDEILFNKYQLSVFTRKVDDLKVEKNMDEFNLSNRVKGLIKKQFDEQKQSLYVIQRHLEKAYRYFQEKPKDHYKIHPKWINPDLEIEDENDESDIEEVTNLSRLDIHVILSEVVHHTDIEELIHKLIKSKMNEMGFIERQYVIKFHFWQKDNVYQNWISLLNTINEARDELSYVIIADCEIDAKKLRKILSYDSIKYEPSEFVASCFIGVSDLDVLDFKATRRLKCAFDKKPISEKLKQYQFDQLPQFEEDEGFLILMMDQEISKEKVLIRNDFAETPIHIEHFIHLDNSLGDSQNLEVLWRTILATCLPEHLMIMLYDINDPNKILFFQSVDTTPY